MDIATQAAAAQPINTNTIDFALDGCNVAFEDLVFSVKQLAKKLDPIMLLQGSPPETDEPVSNASPVRFRLQELNNRLIALNAIVRHIEKSVEL